LLITKCNNETNLSSNGIEIKSKKFSLSDFWHLSLRTMTIDYIYQWKGLLIHLLFYFIFCLCLTKSYNKNIGKYDGCFSFNGTEYSNISCKEREDQKSIIEQNLFFLYFSSIATLIIHVSITTSTFLIEMKILTTEHRNSRF